MQDRLSISRLLILIIDKTYYRDIAIVIISIVIYQPLRSNLLPIYIDIDRV